MSSELSSSNQPSSGRKRSKLRRTTISVLSHAYNLAADIADERIDTASTTGVAAGAAASLLSIGLDKVSSSGSALLPVNEIQGTSILDIEADPSDSDLGYDDTNSESMDSSRRSSFDDSMNGTPSQDHFIDKLLERLLVHAIPRKERENLSLKLHDPERIRKPNLSIRIMVKNFRKLSARMNGLFVVQYGAAHVLTWRRPTVTLTVLVIYTSVCLYPHLGLVIPLLYVLYGIMAPSYIYRHPLDRPQIKKTKKRGKSIFDFFIAMDDSNSLARDIIPDPQPPLNPLDSRPMKENLASSQEELDETTRKSAKSLKNQMELLINMRDLQNLTTDVINFYDQLERFWYGSGGFSDERVSTSLFLTILGSVVIILFFGAYIPWRPIFITMGWAIVGSCHPKSSRIIKNLNRLYLKPQKKKMDRSIQKAEIKDIILDEPPVVREVEIFELEEQGWTPSQWNPYCFTTEIFDKKSKQKQQLPVGCSMLHEVLPPSSWKFDEEKNWQVCKDTNWIIDRNEMRETGDEDGWVYDIESEGIIGRWRRRRWTRDCYRYARPALRRNH